MEGYLAQPRYTVAEGDLVLSQMAVKIFVDSPWEDSLRSRWGVVGSR